MGKTLLWKIGGEAGFGIMTTGVDFSKIAAQLGYNVFSYVEYPSLIRGGHNTYEVHISKEKVRSSKHNIDVLVCLNKETFELHKDRLAPDAVVLYDKEMFEITDKKIQALHLPLKDILKKEHAPIVMMNTIAIGASMGIFNWPLEDFKKRLAKTFKNKGKDIISINQSIAARGYTYVSEHYTKSIKSDIKPRRGSEPQLIMSGNDAFSLGSIIGDCCLYAAYPMTPSSSVLTRLAAYAERTGMIVRHAEDEIAVINTALGSSFSGARSVVGTSGGGFALMTESLSYAGIAEIPIVIFVAQRSGPATGMPTWTEQGDLLFAVHAGHGEFPKIVLAPGDVDEMYELAAEALNLAEIYQTPVIVLSDKHLAESYWSVSKMAIKLFSKGFEVDRGKITDGNSKFKAQMSKYLRYKLTDDGISPMLIPGLKGQFYQANSYEHIEDGHTTEDAEQRIQQVNKRDTKEKTYLKNHFKMPKIYGDKKNARVILVSWGSNKDVLLDAMDNLKEQNVSTALVHFTHMYPLDEKKIQHMFDDDKIYVLVENNSHGQLGRLLRELAGITFKHRFLKYDGRPIFVEDVINFIKGLIESH